LRSIRLEAAGESLAWRSLAFAIESLAELLERELNRSVDQTSLKSEQQPRDRFIKAAAALWEHPMVAEMPL
jgi:hypothetical protein